MRGSDGVPTPVSAAAPQAQAQAQPQPRYGQPVPAYGEAPVYAPAPVYYTPAPAPVYYSPAPVVYVNPYPVVNIGFGYYGGGYRRWR